MDKKTIVKKEFISATIDLIEKCGINNINVRKIAEKTGYKQGSIYNYFKNFKELEEVSSIYFTRDYIREFVENSRNLNYAIEIYLYMWEEFIYYSFKDPRIFYNVFYGGKREFNIFQEYYSLFPEDLPYADFLDEMLILKDSYNRGIYILNECAVEGSIDQEFINHINIIHLRYTKSIVVDLMNGNLDNSFELYRDSLINIGLSMKMYVEKEYRYIIDDFLDFQKNTDNYISLKNIGKNS